MKISSGSLLGRYLSRTLFCSSSNAVLHYFPSGASFSLKGPLTRRFYSDLPPHFKIPMPALSPTMTQGNLASWQKKVGDSVAVGDILAEIETDKATMEFEASEEGFLAKIFVQEGSKDVPVGKLICILAEDKKDIEAFQSFSPLQENNSSSSSSTSPSSAAPSSSPVTPPSLSSSSPSSSLSPAAASSAPLPERIFASPIARKLASEKNIVLAAVKGSGPNGRIVRTDIDNFQSVAASAPAKAAPSSTEAYTAVPLSSMRKIIAQRLTESKQNIPHYYLSSEVVMDKVIQLRKKFNEDAGEEFKLSVNDFIIKAAAKALRKVPECNSSWGNSAILENHYVDISVAVSTDAGLITPIVMDADKKGLADISNTVRDLATRARNNKLQPGEYQGGTFTISNLGMYGIDSFSAIINPPQSCILAVGGAEKKVIVDDSAPTGMRPAQVMTATLSCDHRVVDGAVGAQWLKHFKSYLENPMTLLL